MADLSVVHDKFVEFCKHFKIDLRFHPKQFVPDDLFYGRIDDHYLIKGTVSKKYHPSKSSPFITAIQIAPIVMFIMGLHFKEDKVIVSINRYFFKDFFLEPEDDDPNRQSKIHKMFWRSTQFIAQYIVKACVTCKVTGAEINELTSTNFPELMPYILSLRCLQGSGIPSGETSRFDFDLLAIHLDALLPTDWLSLHHTAELIERRRGLSIRYIYLVCFFKFEGFKL